MVHNKNLSAVGTVKLILDYVSNIGNIDLQKGEVISEILSLQSLNKLMDTILRQMSLSNAEKTGNAVLFLRDFYLSPGLSIKKKKEMMGIIEKNGIYSKLDKMLYAKNYRIRQTSINAIGKLSNKKYQENLVTAFKTFYLKKDPLSVSNLVFEINWLSNKNNKYLLESLVNHKNFIYRWSALELNNCYNFKDKKILKVLLKLETDPMEFIRTQYNKKIKLENEYPEEGFFFAELFANNFLWKNKYRDYSLKRITNIFEYYIQNKKKILSEIKLAKDDSAKIDKVYRKYNTYICK